MSSLPGRVCHARNWKTHPIMFCAFRTPNNLWNRLPGWYNIPIVLFVFIQIPNNQFNLYCDTFNKINKTYCKRLRYACSEHYKDEYTHKVIEWIVSRICPKNSGFQVCGCPLKWYSGGSFRFHELFLSSDAIMADEGFCQEKQKSCMDHKNWVQVNSV